MKILETQSALLSNYEVYQHLVDTQARYKPNGPKNKRREMPKNLAIVVTEILQYFRTPPNPLHDQDKTRAYSPQTVAQLLERIREANFRSELTKGEILSILNLRPASEPLLSNAVEDMDERFNEEEQARLVGIIAEVLGSSEPAEADDDDAGYDEAGPSNRN